MAGLVVKAVPARLEKSAQSVSCGSHVVVEEDGGKDRGRGRGNGDGVAESV